MISARLQNFKNVTFIFVNLALNLIVINILKPVIFPKYKIKLPIQTTVQKALCHCSLTYYVCIFYMHDMHVIWLKASYTMFFSHVTEYLKK